MAGRFDFVSPGAAVTGELQQYLVQREAQRRQAMLDQLAVTREQRLGEQADAITANTKANTDSMIQQRDANAKTAAIDRAGKTFRPGDVLPQGADVPAELTADQMTLPGRVGTVMPGMVAAVGQGQALEQEATGRKTFTGTADQRADVEEQTRKDALAADTTLPEAARAAIRAGVNPTAGMFEPKERERQVVGGYLFEKQDDGTWEKVAEGRPPGEGEGQRAYVIPVQTGQGIVPFNTRTGQFDDANRRDLKPGETAQKEIANAKTLVWSMDQVLTNFTPEKIGPVMGRFQTVEAAITGGDPDFAALSAEVSRLQNTVIQLRTGAQMSEHEAARIMNELPGVNLPPATFIAKLQQVQAYMKEWMQNRATGAYGRTTIGDVDAMTGRGNTTAPAPAAGAAPSPGAGNDPLGIR